MKNIIYVCFVIALLSGVLHADSPPATYHEDFEGDAVSEWSIWAKNADQPCEINFAGPTTERAHSGKKSLKLDLTFREGTYCYWGGKPVRIPAAGDLKFSGYIYVDQLPEGVNVAFGRNLSLPPSGASGVSSSEVIKEPGKEWRHFEIEIGDNTADSARRLLGTDKVYRYVDRVAVLFRGKFKPGQRAVVYVDDLKVTGQGGGEFEKEMAQLVAAEQERQLSNLASWRRRFEEGSEPLNALRERTGKLPEILRQHVSASAASVEESSRKLIAEAGAKLKGKRWLLTREETRWREELDSIEAAIPNLVRLLEYCEAAPDRGSILYTRRAITDRFLLPHELPIDAEPGNVVEITATP
ncbi:MAG: hypothetical protein ACC661_05245, partial [Verrucomicrobiales bacterium]